MLIQCPECKFSRTLDESKIPSTAQIATCPRCKARFRFRNSDENMPESNDANGEERCFSKNFNSHSDIERKSTFSEDGAPREQPHPDNPDALQGDPQDTKTSELPNKPKEGGHDLWDHIASLGEKWEQEKPHRPLGSAQYADEEFSPSGRAGTVPWEHPEQFGLAGGFVHTLIRVLMRGKLFFSSMPQNNNVGRAVGFYFLVIVVHFLVSFIWIRLFSMNTEVAANLEQLNAGFDQVGIFQFAVFIPLNAALTLLMLAVLFSFLFRVSGAKNVTFRSSIRILCYASSGLVLVLVPIIGPFMSLLFVVFSTFQGFAYSYNLPPARAAFLVIPVYFLLFLIVFSTSMSVM